MTDSPTGIDTQPREHGRRQLRQQLQNQIDLHSHTDRALVGESALQRIAENRNHRNSSMRPSTNERNHLCIAFEVNHALPTRNPLRFLPARPAAKPLYLISKQLREIHRGYHAHYAKSAF
jgi:hypothetical protein